MLHDAISWLFSGFFCTCCTRQIRSKKKKDINICSIIIEETTTPLIPIDPLYDYNELLVDLSEQKAKVNLI